MTEKDKKTKKQSLTKDPFDNIIGYADAKRELRIISDILNQFPKYEKLGVKQPHGILLYGEPGVGKTLMAHCLIESINGRKLFVIRKDRTEKFAEKIAGTFESAAECPSIVFIDDMDKFCEGEGQDIYYVIQACMDTYCDDNIFVVATANDIEKLPDSLLRSERIDRVIEIECPEGKDAICIVEHYLGKLKNVDDVDAEEIAKIMDGKSCADLAKVVNEAGIYAGFSRKSMISMKDLVDACLRLFFEASEKSQTSNSNVLRQIAYHEAGHAVVGEILQPNSVSIVSIKEHASGIGGITAYYLPDDYWYSKEMMENRVVTLLAGRAAIELMYGTVDMGANSDIRRAFDIVERLVHNVCAFGFDKRTVWDDSSDALRMRKEDRVFMEMSSHYDKAKRILAEKREILEKVTNALLNETTLTGKQVRELVCLNHGH